MSFTAGRIILPLLTAVLAGARERFQVYTTDNGLPHNTVLAVHQARDGYLWFTTYRGLVRFDGVQFQVFDASNTPGIRGVNFATSSLMEDSYGALWAGTWSTGAIRYQNGVFRTFTTADGLANNNVVRIDQDDHGTIWIYTFPGLSRIRDGKVEVVHSIDGEPIGPYLEAPSNTGVGSYVFGLWRFRHSTLQRFAYGKWSDLPLPGDIRDPSKVQIDSVVEDSERRLWFSIAGRSGDSFYVQNGRLTTFHGLPPGSFANYQDRFGRLWITDHGGHTAYWENGRATPLAGVSTPSRFCVIEDSEGNFWVGMLNQGLAHGTRPVIKTLRLPGDPDVSNIRSIAQDANGDFWIGSYGLTRMHAGNFQTFLLRPAAKWFEAQHASAIWIDGGGVIYCGHENGVRVFRQGKFEDPPGPLLEIKSEVNAILRDPAGDLWLATGDGLYRYHAPQLERFDEGNSAIRGDVRALFQAPTGDLWIGTDGGLCRYRAGRLSCFGSGDALSPWRVRFITGDAGNVIWVGTVTRGLLRVSGDDFCWIQAKDGLYTNDADSVLDDGNGYFWIGSPIGIYRVSKQELNDFAEHRIDRVTSTIFGKNDGLENLSCTGNNQPRAIVAQDGTLWFPTQDGIAQIDPKAVPINRSPAPVRIESCSLEHRPIACADLMTLPPGARDLEIRYTAVNFVKSNQIKFRYQLEGHDPGWVNAGARRTAYYSDLAPGTYTFQVIAANSDGTWNSTGSKLTLTVQPHYYQSVWFRVLVAGLILGIFLFAWRLRAARFGREQARQRAFAQQILAYQEIERKRIAGELHDDLGQRLSVIRNLALLANRTGYGEREGQIQIIADEVSHAIAEVRRISHNLRPYQLDMLGLTKAIEVLVSKTCDAAGIRFEIVADDLSGAFPKEAEIHFYRVVQECLHNITRHSRATVATVLIQHTTAGTSLVISDNGVGFDASSGGSHGFGITGILERAQLLGGRASFESAAGHGTTVIIEINHND